MKKYVILICVFLISAVGHAELWNEIVAHYNDQVITLWDIQREIQVQRVLNKKELKTPMEESVIRQAIRTKIIEELVFEEAQSFGLGLLSETAQEKAFQNFKKSFVSQDNYTAFLKTYAWKEAELKHVISRPLVVEKFIEKKILSAYVHVTRDELSVYLEKHPTQSKGEAEKVIKKEKVQKNLKDWIRNVKRKNTIKVIFE